MAVSSPSKSVVLSGTEGSNPSASATMLRRGTPAGILPSLVIKGGLLFGAFFVGAELCGKLSPWDITFSFVPLACCSSVQFSFSWRETA